MNIAAGSIVIYINPSFNALSGIKTNCSSGINNPIIADIKGILNVFRVTGIFLGKITPFWIWTCGTVGDINGYLTPFEKAGP